MSTIAADLPRPLAAVSATVARRVFSLTASKNVNRLLAFSVRGDVIVKARLVKRRGQVDERANGGGVFERCFQLLPHY
jgi:hypothetical protein